MSAQAAAMYGRVASSINPIAPTAIETRHSGYVIQTATALSVSIATQITYFLRQGIAQSMRHRQEQGIYATTSSEW